MREMGSVEERLELQKYNSSTMHNLCIEILT